MQDAYASEANMVGGWKKIGYVAPGAKKAGDAGSTTNFTYTGPELNAENTTGINGAEVAQAWLAVNNEP